MPFLRFLNSFSSRSFLRRISSFLACILLLLIVANGRALATDTPTPTPGFSTGVPAGVTPTALPAGGSLSTLTYSFLGSQAGFANVTGVWVSGQGFKLDETLELSLIGGYFVEGVTHVDIAYAAGAEFDFVFGLSDGDGGESYNASGFATECEDVCHISFNPGGVDSHAVLFRAFAAVHDSSFAVQSITITFNGDTETYDVGEDGCPQLSPEQYEKLDPLYLVECPICYTTPTPIRDSQIFTTSVSALPTDSGDFSIPLIVSGEPVTPVNTVTPSPSPSPTADPDEVSYRFLNFRTSAYGGVPVSGLGTYVSGQGFASQYNGATTREYLALSSFISSADFDGTISGLTFNYTTDVVFHSIVYFLNSGSIVSTVNRGQTVLGSDLEAEWWFFTPFDFDQISFEFYSGTGADSATEFVVNSVSLQSETPPSPTSTPTPTATGQPWVSTPSPTDRDCSVAVWRDDTPIASFDTDFVIIDYQCYVVFPEIYIDMPGDGHDITADGVSFCVTFFQFPLIEVLGIRISLDWLMVGVVAFLVRLVSRF